LSGEYPLFEVMYSLHFQLELEEEGITFR